MSEQLEVECQECEGYCSASEAKTTADGVKLCPECYEWLREQEETYE